MPSFLCFVFIYGILEILIKRIYININKERNLENCTFVICYVILNTVVTADFCEAPNGMY